MPAFLIVYDLDTPGQKYDGLIAEIKKAFPVHSHFQKSAFMVQSNSTAAQICDHLTKFVDANDKILVIPVQDIQMNKYQYDQNGMELLKVFPPPIPRIYQM